MSTTSLLQTALQNLHVSQQLREQSSTPLPPSTPGSPRAKERALSSKGSSPPTSEDDDEELVRVGKGTAPGTPLPGQKGLALGQRMGSVLGIRQKDPLRTLSTHLAVRIFLQLDIRTLARCDRVCKRWHKSSTLNYVWFLQNRALTLPTLPGLPGSGGNTRALDADTAFFDPYDKSPRLSSLPVPPLPSSPAPQWSKAESKKTWKSTFHSTLKRSDPNAPPEDDPLRVDINSLHSSGASTPSRHSYAGLGSGGASKWVIHGADTGSLTPTERKLAAREGYKAMGGRKARGKRRMGGELGTRDKGGAVDDGRFDAPW